MTELLNKNKVKALKYTGKMALQDKVQAGSKFLKGDASVLEAFELGVDNPRVVRVGCWVCYFKSLDGLVERKAWLQTPYCTLMNTLMTSV